MLLNYSKKLVLILFGLFLSFLFLEVLIRLSLNFFPNEYLPTYGIYQKSFPVIGHKNIPNSIVISEFSLLLFIVIKILF